MSVISKVDIESLESPSAKAVALQDRLAWQREWEKAQWQEQPRRYTGAEENKDDRQTTEPASLSPPPKPDAAPLMQLQLRGSGRGALAAGYTGYRSAPVSGPITGQAGGLPVNDFFGLPFAVSPAPYQAGVVRQSAAAPAVNWLRPEFMQWQPQFVHAVNSAQGLRVWIRDFRVAPNRGGEILSALRRQLAGLGVKLASIVINGDTVWRQQDGQDARSDVDIDGQQLNINYIY